MSKSGYEVILRITELGVRKPYNESSIITQPIDDVLLSTIIPEGGFTKDDDGRVILNVDGLKHLVKATTIALYIEADSKDFEQDSNY